MNLNYVKKYVSRSNFTLRTVRFYSSHLLYILKKTTVTIPFNSKNHAKEWPMHSALQCRVWFRQVDARPCILKNSDQTLVRSTDCSNSTGAQQVPRGDLGKQNLVSERSALHFGTWTHHTLLCVKCWVKSMVGLLERAKRLERIAVSN